MYLQWHESKLTSLYTQAQHTLTFLHAYINVIPHNRLTCHSRPTDSLSAVPIVISQVDKADIEKPQGKQYFSETATLLVVSQSCP